MSFLLPPPRFPHKHHHNPQNNAPKCTQQTYDTILIGTGLSTLSAAALLHRYHPTHKTLLLEAHTTPGGAAHPFQRKCQDGVITFESGPHLFSGLEAGDNNPVGDLFRALGIQPEIITYDSWGVFLGERYYKTTIPSDVLLGEVLSPQGRTEMKNLTKALIPYGKAAKALSIACVRPDLQVGRVLLPRLPRLVGYARYLAHLSKPFAWLLKQYVADELTYNMVNLLCFLLAGVEVERIPLAEVAYMFSEWCGSAGKGVLQRPVGGGYGIVEALIRYIEDRGGVIRLNSKVEKILMEGGRAHGVRLENGDVLRSDRVVCGVSSLDYDRLIGFDEKRRDVCDSFMHLHLAFNMDDLGNSIVEKLEANYVVVDDIYGDIARPGNVVLVSIPSVIDKVGPNGWVVLHAYTPATEVWGNWSGLEEGSEGYRRYKRQRGEVLWRAVNKIFGRDVRNIGMSMVGTPITHARYLSRGRGSYGSRVDARVGLGMGLDGWRAAGGLFRCGDGVFPGVGVPAVVGSGWIIANGCVSVEEHLKLLKQLGV